MTDRRKAEWMLVGLMLVLVAAVAVRLTHPDTWPPLVIQSESHSSYSTERFVGAPALDPYDTPDPEELRRAGE